MNTEIITDTILDEFEQISSYDIKTFLSNYLEFVDQHYSNIANFFSGSSTVNPTNSFNKLKWLTDQKKKIIDIFVLNASSMNSYEFWALLEYIEDIGHALETANNASKWLRSASTSNGYKQQVLSDYISSQGEGLEEIERRVLNSNNPRDSWVDTALENDLTEEDYDLDGGFLIKVIYKNNSSIFLEGIVDNIDEPEKTYGLDIDLNITFENDDLKVLTYKDTLLQCMDILTNLKREDDPSFPDRGINIKSAIGGNVAGISYPIIFRDLAANFATDDSFKSLSVTDVRREQDAVFLDFTVETKVSGTFSQSVQL